MPNIDVTRLINDRDPFDFSASIAERGANAGPETWSNAVTEAQARPLLIDNRDNLRRFFAEFGAWEPEEIASWDCDTIDALVLQYAAGDLHELQSLCPGDGLGDIDWVEAEALAQAGTCSGNLYPDGERLMIYLGN